MYDYIIIHSNHRLGTARCPSIFSRWSRLASRCSCRAGLPWPTSGYDAMGSQRAPLGPWVPTARSPIYITIYIYIYIYVYSNVYGWTSSWHPGAERRTLTTHSIVARCRPGQSSSARTSACQPRPSRKYRGTTCCAKTMVGMYNYIIIHMSIIIYIHIYKTLFIRVRLSYATWEDKYPEASL